MGSKEKDHIYVWEGRDQAGKTVHGQMRAETVTVLKARLRRQGVHVTKVEPVRKKLFRRQLTEKDSIIFVRQLATMLRSGVPLFQTLELTGRSTKNQAIRRVVQHLLEDVENGMTLSDAFARQPENFDDFFCCAVGAGEQSGALDQILRRLADQKERVMMIRSRLKSASIQPALTLAVAVIVSTIFTGFSLLFAVFFLVGLVIAVRFMMRYSPVFAGQVSMAVSHIPVFGTVLKKSALVRWLSTLSILYRAGVPMDMALQTTGGIMKSGVYKKATEQLYSHISAGSSLSDAMRDIDVFPEHVLQMVNSGEQSGQLDQMLDNVADLYQEEITQTVKRILAVFPQVLLVIVAIIVFFTILSFYGNLMGRVAEVPY